MDKEDLQGAMNPPPYTGGSSGQYPALPGTYPTAPDPYLAPADQYPAPPGQHIAHTPTVIFQPSPCGVQVVLNPPMGAKPSRITCNTCQAEVLTKIKVTSTTKTHLLAILLCAVGCCLCSCIPYCVDSCRKIDHYCPNCNAYIGSSK